MMKCLSVRQPWADLIVNGPKDIENRVWRTSYRGPILIHASKAPVDGMALTYVREVHRLELARMNLAHGAIVGIATVVDCVEYQKGLGPWAEQGGWCWRLAGRKRLDHPIPWKGQLNLFDVPTEIVKAVLAEPKIAAVGYQSDSFKVYYTIERGIVDK